MDELQNKRGSHDIYFLDRVTNFLRLNFIG
jgi:hypothetical protein